MTAPVTVGVSSADEPPRADATAGATVRGDGMPGGQRVRRRWQRWRWPGAVASLVVLVGLAAALPEPPRSTVPLAPDNPGELGARALAQVLEGQGVDIEYVRRTSQALGAAERGGTVLVAGTSLLSVEQVEALAALPNDLVLLEPDSSMLSAVTDAADTAAVADAPGLRTAVCDDPDAQAAEAVRVDGGGYLARTDAATVCFPGPDPGVGAYLVVEEDRRITALADSSLLTNQRLAEDGNAALTLRMLGRHDRLVWYVPSFDDVGETLQATGPALGELVPPWATVLAAQGLVVAAVAAVWRGRRLGRLVTEPLPVVVRAAETTRGRGRLYRRARAHGHAAAALRAGTATRAATRLGLPRSAGAPAVIDALARATGRSTDEVAALLYGPPPTDDAGLTRLARRLDELESEVHRP